MKRFFAMLKRNDISVVYALPFASIHIASLLVFLVPFAWKYLALTAVMYYARMFFITAGYHRYFSHRAYKMGRVPQFLMALGGTTAAQKGVLWWSSHHRVHHILSDTPKDIHSAKLEGFWWSHMGWILSNRYKATDKDHIRDFLRFPELRWLNRWHLVPPAVLAAAIFFWGGLSALAWGFFFSTALLWHGTFTINSLSHMFGWQRYPTADESRNNWFLALFVTMGEGWHNNHHYHCTSARQGFAWYEVDLTYYILWVLSKLRIIHRLNAPPPAVLAQL